MDYTNFLGAIIGPFLLVMGLSLLMYAKVWVKLTKNMEKEHTAIVLGMAFSMLVGLAFIQMHNVWEWSIWVVITIFGWMAFLKGLFYFLAPGVMIQKSIKILACKNLFYFSGLVFAVLGAWMSYLIYLA